MRKLIVLILLILPTLIFSQDRVVWEMVIGVDTVTVIRKDHAKDLARERVNYWYLLEEVKEKGTLIDGLRESLSKAKEEREIWSELVKEKDSRLEFSKQYQQSQGRTIGLLEDQLKSQKRSTFIYILIAILGITGMVIK